MPAVLIPAASLSLNLILGKNVGLAIIIRYDVNDVLQG